MGKDPKVKVTAAAASGSADLNTSLASSQGSLGQGEGHEEREKERERERERVPGCGASSMPEEAQRKLKALSLGQGEKDVYRQFKEKRSSPTHPSTTTHPYTTTGVLPGCGDANVAATTDASANLEERYRAIKAQYSGLSPLETELAFDAYDGLAHAHAHHRSELRGPRAGKAEPPSTLDVMPSRAVRLLQASTVSTISGDESIGECSLDAELTGE